MTVTRVTLPTLHPDQVKLFHLREDARSVEGAVGYDPAWGKNSGGRFKASRCGRRWGKSNYGETWIGDGALKGEPTGWFAPTYKLVSEVYAELTDILKPVIVQQSKTDGLIRLRGGGRIDFWTLEDDRAGRSRKYKRVFVDEGAFTKPNMMDIWERSIKPTLLDYTGRAMVASNTNGVDPENFLYQVCNDAKHGFIEYHAPSRANPLIPARLLGETDEDWRARQDAVYADLKAREHPLVYSQEYEAEFVDWSGVAFFSPDKLLEDGAPIPWPTSCDAVYAVVDSATKTGSDNDGTAVAFWAISRHKTRPLLLLDWDIIQIEAALLEVWLPSVFVSLEEMARKCGARAGALGVWIEDKDSGQILLQQSRRKQLKVHAIDSGLTSLGKDGRAISVSGYVYNCKVGFSDVAYNKTLQYKGTTRNHMLSQVTGFRVGDKDAAKRADDLLDTFTYGVSLSLGNKEGF